MLQQKNIHSTNVVLTKSIGRNANFNFLIDNDELLSVGDIIIITSKTSGYTLAEVLEPDDSYTIDYDLQTVSYDITRTRYNENKFVFKISEFEELKLLQRKKEIQYQQSHVDPTLEAIFKIINQNDNFSSDLKAIDDRINELLTISDNRENLVKVSTANMYDIYIENFWLELWEEQNKCLHALLFDGEKIFVDKINLMDDFPHSNKVKTLMIIEEIIYKDEIKRLKRNNDIKKVKKELEKHRLILDLFSIEEIESNTDVPEFVEIIRLKRQLLDLLKNN